MLELESVDCVLAAFCVAGAEQNVEGEVLVHGEVGDGVPDAFVSAGYEKEF